MTTAKYISLLLNVWDFLFSPFIKKEVTKKKLLLVAIQHILVHIQAAIRDCLDMTSSQWDSGIVRAHYRQGRQNNLPRLISKTWQNNTLYKKLIRLFDCSLTCTRYWTSCYMLETAMKHALRYVFFSVSILWGDYKDHVTVRKICNYINKENKEMNWSQQNIINSWLYLIVTAVLNRRSYPLFIDGSGHCLPDY